jgi:peptidoglycan/xylan/chitin deacetylase (PgdA/CDA1 family)
MRTWFDPLRVVALVAIAVVLLVLIPGRRQPLPDAVKVRRIRHAIDDFAIEHYRPPYSLEELAPDPRIRHWRDSVDRPIRYEVAPSGEVTLMVLGKDGKLGGQGEDDDVQLTFKPTYRRPRTIVDRIVVLTFDDSVASHYTVARPILKKYGFGATFFITEGFEFKTDKRHYMTWEQIAELHRDGFEIGNHTRDHMGVNDENVAKLAEQLEAINARCEKHGIPRTTTFAWPGNSNTPEAFEVLRAAGIKFARRGGEPEYPYKEGRGFAYEPGRDHPLLIPSAGDARPDWTLEDFKRAAEQAKDGRSAVLQFHGVPDVQHPWVHTDPEKFKQYMKYLKDNNYRVIALRDLVKYVDPAKEPERWETVIEERKKAIAANERR